MSVPPVPENSSKTIDVNENSPKLDFILRNGLAGGIAGCAVSLATFTLSNDR